MNWAKHAANLGEMRNSYKILVVKPVRKKSFGRLRGRYEDNIKMNLEVMRCETVDWINLAEDMV
jgi:hypothetical protein